MSKGGNMAKMFPIQRLGYPAYPSLSKLLNKKGYLGYLARCTPCLKAFPRLSKTHFPSLDPREPRLVKNCLLRDDLKCRENGRIYCTAIRSN